MNTNGMVFRAIPFFVDIVYCTAYNEATEGTCIFSGRVRICILGSCRSQVAAVNHCIAHQTEAMTENKQQNRDQVILSSGGRKQSMLETLIKQHQELVDQKKNVAEDGNGPELKSRLEAYDKQIAELDKMIAQVEAQQEEPKESSGIYERPKTTEQQAEAAKAKHLLDIAAGHDQAQALFGLRAEMIGRTRVLEAELKTGYNADPVGKAQESAALRSKATQLGSKIAETTQGITNTVKEIHEQAPDNQKKKEEQNKILA